jgi:hypothetical protein
MLSGAKSKDWSYHLPSQEEFAILRNFRKVELQFREAVLVAREKARRVCFGVDP